MLRETALQAYDSLLTLLAAEVPYIWKRKWKLGTVLYLLARYPSLHSNNEILTVDLQAFC